MEPLDFETAKIIEDVRKNVELDASDTSFDNELLTLINGFVQSLYQIDAVNPVYITTETTWEELMNRNKTEEQQLAFPLVMATIFVKTKLLFDPPSATTKESMEKAVKEWEWRLGVAYNAVGGGT